MPYKDIEKRRLKSRQYTDKWRAANPEKIKASNKKSRERLDWSGYMKEWCIKNPESRKRTKRQNLLRRYGLTFDSYASMLNTQHNRCKICLREFSEKLKPNVDHNHVTGQVRGLLCFHCNSALGSIHDDEFIAARLIAYLKWSETINSSVIEAMRFADLPEPKVSKKPPPTEE